MPNDEEELAAARMPIGPVLPWPGAIDSGVPSDAPVKDLPKNGTIPKGWALCNGQWLDYVGQSKNRALFDDVLGGTYGVQRSHATDEVVAYRLPDYRGVFLRGGDWTKGLDPDAEHRSAHDPASEGSDPAQAGSRQADELERHSHTEKHFTVKEPGSSGGLDGGPHKFVNEAPHTPQTSKSGGNETRPVNVAVHWIIRVRG